MQNNVGEFLFFNMQCVGEVTMPRICTHMNSYWNKIKTKQKKAYILTPIDHQAEKFEEFYLCFYPRIPQI